MHARSSEPARWHWSSVAQTEEAPPQLLLLPSVLPGGIATGFVQPCTGVATSNDS